MNTINNDDLNSSSSGRPNKKLTAQQNLASEALLTGILDVPLSSRLEGQEESSRTIIDTGKETSALFDDFLGAYDDGDRAAALRLSNILFYVHGEKKLKEALTKRNFCRFLIFRVELLINTEEYGQVAESIKIASNYEVDMEETDKDMYPHLTWLKAKFYLYEKKYSSAINSIEVLIKSRKDTIESKMYESLILAKAEALCGLKRYEEVITLIDKEFSAKDQQDVFDIRRWKAEAFLHLERYEELEHCIASMKIIEPQNIIIANFRKMIDSQN